MRVMFPFLLAVVSVAGCAPLSIYHKAGVPVARWQVDTTDCQAQAVREVPASNQVRQDPPIYVPSRRVCHGPRCHTVAGYWVPGEIYTVDVNRGLRQRVETLCMAERGYRPVDIPRCPGGVRVSGPTTALPPLTPNSCFVPLDRGGFAIVDGARPG